MTDLAACGSCLRPIYYDRDSGLWLHERLATGNQTDLMNGLFCMPEEWEKDYGDRRYVTPFQGPTLVDRLRDAEERLVRRVGEPEERTPMIVYILLYNCGDYYCGCPGGVGDDALHIAGLYASEDLAEKAKGQLPARLQYDAVIRVGRVEV